MRIVRFDWDDANEEHIARHGVGPSEVEEVFRGHPLLRRTRQGRYLAYGPTADGRLLFVVFAIKRAAVRVITSRDMTRRERVAFRRQMR
jgi:uncharacterized DUF497 family protein